MNQNKVLSVRNIVLIAMFSALAAVLETIQVAVPFAPPFYKLDFAELPVLIGGFAMGPVQAALIAIVKNLLKLLLNGTSTYYVGELGNIIGSCMFSVPAALIYRRSIAKDVLGTDDPAEVQEKLNSWDKFNAVAADAKAKGYLMTASEAATYRVFSNNVSQSWVDADNKLQIDPAIQTWMTQAKDFSDNGYTQDCDIWSDECTAQMFGDGKAMCYFGPAWYFNFSMGNAQDAEKGCFGDWAICEGPQAHFWGGTWLLAPAGTDNPTMVADIMNTFINDEEVCTNLVKNEAQFSNNQKVNETVAKDPSYGSDFLGGQNDIALFCDLAKNIKFENHTIYDQLLNEGLQANWREYCKGTVTEDEAMSNFYKYINEKYPTIVTP